MFLSLFHQSLQRQLLSAKAVAGSKRGLCVTGDAQSGRRDRLRPFIAMVCLLSLRTICADAILRKAVVEKWGLTARSERQ